jgi:hypothetical protein
VELRKLTLGLALILSLSLIVGIACGGGEEEGPGVTPSPPFTPTPSMSTPTPTLGIDVDHPADWTWSDELVTGTENAVAAFRSPMEENSFHPHMVVTRTALPIPLRVGEVFGYAHSTGHQAEEFAGYVSVSDEDITVDGLPAIKHVFTYSEGGLELKAKQLWVVKELEAWVVRYVTAEDSFDSWESVLDDILHSFTFL